jgi:hypothetical protein
MSASLQNERFVAKCSFSTGIFSVFCAVTLQKGVNNDFPAILRSDGRRIPV